MFIQKVSLPKRTTSDQKVASCIDISVESYGTSTWELFYIMMKETDKNAFYRQLQMFRNKLASHEQHKLLDYFEQNYFPEHRILQWATWFRHGMYNCEWLADTNMHVESWHNYLKTHILDRKKNVRVDSLMYALRRAENMYHWKWSRVRAGWVKNANPGWITMLGLPAKVHHIQQFSPDHHVSLTKRSPCKINSNPMMNKQRLMVQASRVNEKLKSVDQLSDDKAQTLGKHFTFILNLLTSTIPVPKNLITTPVIPSETKRLIIPRVIDQYKFVKKRPRLCRNVMSVKAFRNNKTTRDNRMLSFQLNDEDGDKLTWDPSKLAPMESVIHKLSIMRSRKNVVSLGGITFSPMLGGIVVPVKGNMESLHVRVLRVEPNSVAYKHKITTQMFLKTMALVNGDRIGEAILMGASTARVYRSDSERTGDMWRDKRYTVLNNTLDLEIVMRPVESMLSTAMLFDKQIQVELIRYKV